MARLVSFQNISLDGYFTDATSDVSWAYSSADPEYDAFVADNARSGGLLVFGRVTYQMMAGYWPTPAAAKDHPVVAERMNAVPKIVFSRTLTSVSWRNTTLVKGELADEIRRLKRGSGRDMAILGSGSLVAQLAQERLIDEYQLVVNPVALGSGKTLFSGVGPTLPLQLRSSRTFPNGKVYLCYVC